MTSPLSSLPRIGAPATRALTGAGYTSLGLLEDVSADVVREATPDAPEALIGRRTPGQFLGELGLLTGQASYLTARATSAGTVTRITPASLRRLMDEDPELSDLLLRAF